MHGTVQHYVCMQMPSQCLVAHVLCVCCCSQGTYIYRKDEGCVYSGDWVHGRRHGKGKLSFLDGSFYRGDFKNDQMWGKGIYVDAADGTQYDGEWYKNMRQGFGTLIDGLGAIYHGEFWANMKHGPVSLVHLRRQCWWHVVSLLP